MKILQINSRVNKGSASRITEQIGQLVLANGWDSYIAYARPSGVSSSKLIRIGSSFDYKLHYLLSLIFDKEGLFSTRATRRLIKEIKRISPDIIHLQNIHGHYLNYKLLFEYLNTTNLPVVWTLHDCWSFTGHCAHFVSVGCNKWQTICHDCALKKHYPKSILLDNSKVNFNLKKSLFMVNKNLHIITVSRWLEELARKSFLENCDIKVISNGINLGVYYPRVVEKNDVFHILGVASVWSTSKGYDDFMKLRTRLPKDKYKITLVGLNGTQMKKLPDGINGVIRTDTIQELAKLYSQADVFVNLTYADTFPTVNIESLACGTPVITYNTGGSPEIVDDLTGIIVERGNLWAVVEAIQTVERKGKAYYTKACVDRASTMYDMNERFNDYIKLYKELCQ